MGQQERRLLARSLRKKASALRIHSIKDKRGALNAVTVHIAGEFREYYSLLYNLSPPRPRETRMLRTDRSLSGILSPNIATLRSGRRMLPL